MTAANDLAVRRALEAAGVEFIDENGGGPGVTPSKTHERKASEINVRCLSGFAGQLKRLFEMYEIARS